MGLLERLKYDIYSPTLTKLYPKVWHDKPLSISQLGIVTIILAVGHVLTVPVFFCELMAGRGKKALDHQSKDSAMPAKGEDLQVDEIEFTQPT